MPVCRGANPEPYWLIIRLRRCLATWALAAARGVPVRKVLRQRGWSRPTFYRKLDGGAARIAAILGERGDLITYLCLLDADVEGAGVKSHESCCILIRNMNPIAPGGRSTAIYRVPNG